jgi:hypothetical protein
MEDSNGRHIPWALFFSELIGTALLVLVGLSLVILMFGAGTPMARLIPSEGLRRLVTGFLFGTTGACIALSAVGRVSGAHINPAVTLAFRLMGKLDLPTTVGYVGAQSIGAVVGRPLATGRGGGHDHELSARCVRCIVGSSGDLDLGRLRPSQEGGRSEGGGAGRIRPPGRPDPDPPVLHHRVRLHDGDRPLRPIFLRDASGRRPVHGGAVKFQEDPHWRDLILFYEYFHGDNGAGIGVSHQTGWTGLVARLLDLFGRVTAQDALETPKERLDARLVREQVGGD